MSKRRSDDPIPEPGGQGALTQVAAGVASERYAHERMAAERHEQMAAERGGVRRPV